MGPNIVSYNNIKPYKNFTGASQQLTSPGQCPPPPFQTLSLGEIIILSIEKSIVAKIETNLKQFRIFTTTALMAPHGF